MIVPDLKEAKERHAKLVNDEKRQIMCWLRRNTSLTDEAVEENVFKPLLLMLFDAGYEIGCIEMARRVERELRVSRWMFRVAFVATAACVALWLSS
jgi:hypothetical protein